MTNSTGGMWGLVVALIIVAMAMTAKVNTAWQVTAPYVVVYFRLSENCAHTSATSF